jgi:hypothetical protein
MDMITNMHLQDDQFIVANTQDVEPILNACKVKQDIGKHSSEMKHAASIPLVVIEDYCKRCGITFQEWLRDKAHIKRVLNDPDFKMFRIWPGAV